MMMMIMIMISFMIVMVYSHGGVGNTEDHNNMVMMINADNSQMVMSCDAIHRSIHQ